MSELKGYGSDSRTLESAVAAGCPHAAAAASAAADVVGAADVTGTAATSATPVTSAQRPALKALPTDAFESAAAVSKGCGDGKTGILLVNHGSRATIWRRMLLDVHTQVADQLLAIPGVAQVRTAYMEYTEPSIATQLKAFDEAGITDVLVVPLLLTVSDHSLDDIPAICGQPSSADLLQELASENIEVYKPRADIQFAPLLDFSGLVRKNLAKRAAALMGPGVNDGQTTGLVLVGYGSAEFDDEWNTFFKQTRDHAEEDLGITASTHAWCGHLVEYSRKPTVDAINQMLEAVDQVIVIPQLVSYDPMFQERIIGRATTQSADPSRVLYSADAILPEPEVGNWVVRISQEILTPVEAASA